MTSIVSGLDPGAAVDTVGAFSGGSGVDDSVGSEQAYVNGAESPTTVAAQHMYTVSASRPLTVTGVVGSLAKADEGNHVPSGSHSFDVDEHWNAYPWTVTALPLAGSGNAAATSSDW